jgi:hypothetical protein
MVERCGRRCERTKNGCQRQQKQRKDLGKECLAPFAAAQLEPASYSSVRMEDSEI